MARRSWKSNRSRSAFNWVSTNCSPCWRVLQNLRRNMDTDLTASLCSSVKQSIAKETISWYCCDFTEHMIRWRHKSICQGVRYTQTHIDKEGEREREKRERRGHVCVCESLLSTATCIHTRKKVKLTNSVRTVDKNAKAEHEITANKITVLVCTVSNKCKCWGCDICNGASNDGKSRCALDSTWSRTFRLSNSVYLKEEKETPQMGQWMKGVHNDTYQWQQRGKGAREQREKRKGGRGQTRSGGQEGESLAGNRASGQGNRACTDNSREQRITAENRG